MLTLIAFFNMCLLSTRLPAEIKLYLLEVAASTGLEILFALGKVDGGYKSLLAAQEQRLLLRSLKSQIGEPEHIWVLCVAVAVMAFDGIEQGKEAMPMGDGWLNTILTDALNGFPNIQLDRKTAQVAINILQMHKENKGCRGSALKHTLQIYLEACINFTCREDSDSKRSIKLLQRALQPLQLRKAKKTRCKGCHKALSHDIDRILEHTDEHINHNFVQILQVEQGEAD